MRIRTLAFIAALLAAPSVGAASWEEQRADLAFARDHHLSRSLAYSPEARREAAAFIDATIARGEKLSDEAFLLATLRIAALAGNAHETAWGGWLPATRLPVRILWFPDAMVVARAAPEHHALLGARIESIEGLAPDELMARLRSYFGGTDDNLRWNATWAMELGGLLHAMGVGRDAMGLRLRVLRLDGVATDVNLPFVARSAAATGARPPRLWSPPPYESERKHGWRSAIDGREPPLYLREADEPFRIVPLTAMDALYVQFRANSTADAGGRDIKAFVERVRATLDTSRPKNLVLDLRFDIGGDIGQTRDLARAMVAAVPGRIFVLTGPYTFSAGIVFAAAMKREGGARVTLVGEPVGDRLRFWSEGGHVCLPHSKVCFWASDGLWDLRKGCAGEPACYGDRFDARVDSLDPEVRAPLTAAAWLSGRDPAMEAVLAALGH